MGILNKVVLILAGVLILAVLSFLGVQAYGDKRAAQSELSGVKEAVSEAVAARTAAGKVDVQQAHENTAKRESVRLVLERNRNATKVVHGAIGAPDCVGDAERIRLLNESIRAVNAVIAAPGVLPERL